MAPRLVVISCSARKKNDPGTLPAIERYQGITYKVIHKARKEGYWPDATDLFIISARYGLISEHELIEWYDLKMSEERARACCSTVSHAFDTLLRYHPYEAIFINLGQTYMLSLASSTEYIQAYKDGRLQQASGAIGQRLRQTKNWLLHQKG